MPGLDGVSKFFGFLINSLVWIVPIAFFLWCKAANPHPKLPMLTGVIGKQRTGKTHYALEMALQLANDYHKTITCNFVVNKKAIKEYCRLRGLKWFEKYGRIRYVSLQRNGKPDPSRLPLMLRHHNAVIILDEAGWFINSRNWAQVPAEFTGDTNQLGKNKQFVICIFHFLEQVDKQLRLSFQRWIVVKGDSKFSRKLNGSELIYRECFHFESDKFHFWAEDRKLQVNYLRTSLMARAIDRAFIPGARWLAALSGLGASIAYVLDFYRGLPVAAPAPARSRHDLLFWAFQSFSKPGDAAIQGKKKQVSYQRLPGAAAVQSSGSIADLLSRFGKAV